MEEEEEKEEEEEEEGMEEEGKKKEEEVGKRKKEKRIEVEVMPINIAYYSHCSQKQWGHSHMTVGMTTRQVN